MTCSSRASAAFCALMILWSPLMLTSAEVFTDSSDATISCAQERGELEIRFKNQRILLYAFSAIQFKPYVKELFTPEGENVLLDAPSDHLHHHGLMYAVRLNGVNFWEEAEKAGRQRSVKLLSHRTGKSAAGLPAATFSHLIHWLGPEYSHDGDSVNHPLLIETRTITLTLDTARPEVALEWRSDFAVGPGVARIQITGSGYNGLGLRLASGFDRVARHENSANLPYTAEGKWDVTQAKWSAVTGPTPKGEAMLALFATPSNKGDTRFFTMRNPFTYLSVTQNVEQQPIEYSAGDKFSVRYLLTVYSGAKPAEFLNSRYARWMAN